MGPELYFMRSREFYRKCFKHALGSGFVRAEFIASIISLILVPVGADWKMPIEFINWAPFLVFITAFVVTFGIRFFSAPVDFYNEALQEIGQLKLTIEDREKIQKALNHLWQLRKTGVELRNKTISPKTHPTWHKEFQDWHDEVGAQASLISENLKQWLITLDQVTQPPIVDFVSPDHRKDLTIFNEILHRLQRFLEKDLAWPKIGA